MPAIALYCTPGIENTRPLSKSSRAVLHQEVGVEPHVARPARDVHPLVELGLGEPRAERRHGDALRAVLVRRPLAEAVDPRLGRGVGAPRQERRDARHVDDAAVPAFGHRAQRGMGQPEHGRDQHVEHRLLGLDLVDQEPLLEPEARVVDQQVDRPVRVGESRLDRPELLAVAEVGRQHLDLDVVRRAELGRDLLQPLDVAGHQHQVVAACGELGGEAVTDAGGGSGDHGGGHAAIQTGGSANEPGASGMMVPDDHDARDRQPERRGRQDHDRRLGGRRPG